MAPMTEVEHADKAAPGTEAHHAAFDPEPVHELPPDEPRSPLWLPLVGLGILALGGLWLALRSTPAAPKPGGSASATTTTAAPPAPPAGATAAPTQRPAGTASTVVTRPPTREDIDRIREQMRQMQEGKAK
jgi:hypothetical protein